jgi:hypothetical protein
MPSDASLGSGCRWYRVRRLVSSTPEHRAELEKLQAELASRQSITDFAHAAVSMLLALISAGTSARMFFDFSGSEEVYCWMVAALSLGFATYSLTRYLNGRRNLAIELERFAALKRLHRIMGLDDPSALLPQ